MLAQDKANHAKHLLLQFGPPRYIARGIVMGREQKPLETVLGPVCWDAIPNDGPGQGLRFCGTTHRRR